MKLLLHECSCNSISGSSHLFRCLPHQVILWDETRRDVTEFCVIVAYVCLDVCTCDDRDAIVCQHLPVPLPEAALASSLVLPHES